VFHCALDDFAFHTAPFTPNYSKYSFFPVHNPNLKQTSQLAEYDIVEMLTQNLVEVGYIWQGMLEVKIFLHEIEALLRGFENSFEYN
jgi:hypothetical protein